MLFLIGIDDTDNGQSIDTSELAVRLGKRIEERLRCRLISVTRHRLYSHIDIAATSDNAAACIAIDGVLEDQRDIELVSREFLLHECAPGSDPGFAMAAYSILTSEISTWGLHAKEIVLERQAAMQAAHGWGISIAGFTGKGTGVIGALAAIGLYFDGNDGYFSWLPRMLDLKGVYTMGQLMEISRFDRIENLRGRRPLINDRIRIGDWARPILKDGKSLYLLEAARKDESCEWVTISRERLEQLVS